MPETVNFPAEIITNGSCKIPPRKSFPMVVVVESLLKIYNESDRENLYQ